MANDAFRAELVELVKASGQELIDSIKAILEYIHDIYGF